MIRVIFRSLWCLALCVLPGVPGHSQTRIAKSRPKLIVLVVVDQFRFDYYPKFSDRYSGGLKLLLDNGANFVDAQLEHYPAVTAVGHATMLTGAAPGVSGIIGNDWFDRESGAQVASTYDPAVQPLGEGVKVERAAGSPRRLLVGTVGDELKRAKVPGGTKVIGLSYKPWSAIFPTGRTADAAY